jgi:HEAT repeats
VTEEINRLSSELHGKDSPDSRREAAARLQEAGLRRRTSLAKRGHFSEPARSPLEDEPLEALHSAIEDDDTEVRRLAIKSAGDLGDGRSVEALTAALWDPDLKVRLAAVISLGEIGGPQSVRALSSVIRSQDQPDDMRLAALTELEELAAKPITSGPDRRFDPPETPAREEPVERRGIERTKDALIDTLADVEATDDEDAIMKLKAADVRRYLEGGAYS